MVDSAVDQGQSGKSDAERKAPPEVTDPPKKSLSALLSEWEEKDKGGSGKGEPKGEPKESADDLAKRLAALEGELSKTNYETDMKSVVSTVKGDLPVDDKFVEDWVNRKADGDPRLVELWEKRDERKSQFQEAIKALQPEFKAYVDELKNQLSPKQDEAEGDSKKPDRGLAAAVRNSREASPSSGYDDVKWASLPDSELALKKNEVFAAARAGKLK